MQLPKPGSEDQTVEFTTIETGFGPLTVDVKLYRVWNAYGWPTESAIEKMVNEQKERFNG